MSTILNSRVFIWDYTRIHDVVDIKNTHFQSSTRNNQTRRIQKNPLRRGVSKYAVHWFRRKKTTRFRKYPDLCGRDLCIQTAVSLLGFYCNKKPEHSQLYVSCLQLNLPSSRLIQKSLKSSAMIAAKKGASDWVDHTTCGDKNGAEISVYIWTTGTCNTREQTKRYQLVNDVAGPAKKKKQQHNSDSHLKHVSVSSRALFLGVGSLFTWMDLLFKLDHDDGVKCNQLDSRDENKNGGNCKAVNI